MNCAEQGCPRGGEIVDYCIGLCSCGECPTPRPDWEPQAPTSGHDLPDVDNAYSAAANKRWQLEREIEDSDASRGERSNMQHTLSKLWLFARDACDAYERALDRREKLVAAEREAITRHLVEHRNWAEEPGRMTDDAHHARFFIDHGVIHDRVTGKHVRTALNGEEDGVDECCALLNSLADACLRDGLPTFEEAWAEKVAAGYQYGEDALQGVRFGWKIRESVERRAKKAHLFKTAERLADARAQANRLRFALGRVADELSARPLASASTVDAEIIAWRQRILDGIEAVLEREAPTPRTAQALPKKGNPST